MITLSKLSLIACLTASVGFGQASAPQGGAEPFSIVLTPTASNVKAGSDVFVKLKVTNTSQRDVVGQGGFYADGLNTGFQYDCHDTSGKSVAKEINTVVGSVGGGPMLHPAESYEETERISQACDFTRAGQYDIQISRKIPGDLQHRVVKSNIIRITVKLAVEQSEPPKK